MKIISTKKVVFITGSANGIGKHLSAVFYQQGYRVIATDFLIAKLSEQTSDVSVIFPDLVHTNMLTVRLDCKAAALTFSGKKTLTVHDIEKAIFNNALAKKQVEILVPLNRGWTAKLGNLFPSLGFWLTNALTKKGLEKQAEYKNIDLLSH